MKKLLFICSLFASMIVSATTTQYTDTIEESYKLTTTQNGKIVSVKVDMPFTASDSVEPADDIQTCIRVSTNGFFQVWSTGSSCIDGMWIDDAPHWINIKPTDIVLETGKIYTVEMILDYNTCRASVNLIDQDHVYKFSSINNGILVDGITSFPLCTKTGYLKSVSLVRGNTAWYHEFEKSM